MHPTGGGLTSVLLRFYHTVEVCCGHEWLQRKSHRYGAFSGETGRRAAAVDRDRGA